MANNWGREIANVRESLTKLSTASELPFTTLDAGTLANTFDHTLLKPEATSTQIQTLCEEAIRYHFATVCIREPFVYQAHEVLKGNGVKICSVVGFHDPTAATLEQKLAEGRAAVAAGASELDMVIDWPALKHKEYETVHQELRAFRDAFPQPIVLKVIFETSQLSQGDIVAASVLASRASFDFIKTSTGFVGGGAKVEDVRLMRQICELEGKGMSVKASGGIRSLQDAMNMLEAGAGRLGASASVAIMAEKVSTG